MESESAVEKKDQEEPVERSLFGDDSTDEMKEGENSYTYEGDDVEYDLTDTQLEKETVVEEPKQQGEHTNAGNDDKNELKENIDSNNAPSNSVASNNVAPAASDAPKESNPTSQQQTTTSTQQQSSSGKERRVYVGNLSYQVTWKELKDYLRKCGNVLYADVLTDYNGMSKGCGVVEYSTKEEANRAIAELNNTQLLGRSIFIRGDREEGSKLGYSHSRWDNNKSMMYNLPGMRSYGHDGGRGYDYKYPHYNNGYWDSRMGHYPGVYNKYRRYNNDQSISGPPFPSRAPGISSRYEYHPYKDRTSRLRSPRMYYPRRSLHNTPAYGYQHDLSRHNSSAPNGTSTGNRPSASYYNYNRNYLSTSRPSSTQLYPSQSGKIQPFYYRNYNSSYPSHPTMNGEPRTSSHNNSNAYVNLDSSSSIMQYDNRAKYPASYDNQYNMRL